MDILAVVQGILTFIIVLGAPIATLVWFIVSLVLFLKTPKEHEKRRARKRNLIISGILAVCFWGFIIWMMCMLAYGLAHM